MGPSLQLDVLYFPKKSVCVCFCKFHILVLDFSSFYFSSGDQPSSLPPSERSEATGYSAQLLGSPCGFHPPFDENRAAGCEPSLPLKSWCLLWTPVLLPVSGRTTVELQRLHAVQGPEGKGRHEGPEGIPVVLWHSVCSSTVSVTGREITWPGRHSLRKAGGMSRVNSIIVSLLRSPCCRDPPPSVAPAEQCHVVEG